MQISRTGMTILEMMIAVAIFATAVVMAFEFMASSKRFVDGSASRENLRLEGRNILSAIAADIGNSAWFLETVDDRAELLEADDRDLRYYPYVQVQREDLRGERFQAHHRDDDEIVALEDFAGNDYPASHLLPSQEIIFLKVSKGLDGETPREVNSAMVNFNEPALPMEDYWLGEVATSMSMTEAAAGAGEIDAALTWEKQASSGDMREYSYVVVPSEGGRGIGQLERRYHHRSDANNGAGEIVTDRVLSRYVDRIVFDTYRTTTGLAVDQIRLTVYLSREDEAGVLYTHSASITVAMRSTVDPNYSQSIDDWLGDAGLRGFDL